MSKMSNLRASATFVWSTTAILGKGATGAVYQGINKKSGEAVAVKTFNSVSHMRPYDVQIREFDVLKKVKHENIVKLLAIEQEGDNNSKVLVMELCTGGSLFTILDDPENMFGLCEDEFLLVLKHLSDGMKHLRDNSVVHRDLKPGNIMKFISEDGRSIYKLTDFGAARELEDDQQFMSLYGTEEYLHPDMYERAVLRKASKTPGKAFGATVDLWSIGVTLYHVATGSLPFRPYGGRRNREMMYYITTEKESGVISGVQTSENGPIDWSRELPATCQLSIGLRKLVTPIFASLMECDAGRMWTFDNFFAEVSRLFRRIRLMAFHVERCRMMSLYVDPDDGLEELRCAILEQTDLPPERQCLLFDSKLLEETVTSGKTVSGIPKTGPGNPIFVLGQVDSKMAPVEGPPIPKFPNFPNAVTPEHDAHICKTTCGIAHCIQRTIERSCTTHQHLKSAACDLASVAVAEFRKLKAELDLVEATVATVSQKTKMLLSHHRTTSSLVDLFGINDLVLAEEKNRLHLLVNSKQESNATVTKQLLACGQRLTTSYDKVVGEQQLLNQWKDTPASKQDLGKCPARAATYVQTLRGCWQHLARNRNARVLSFSDEQFHTLEKLKSQETKQKLLSLHQEECQVALRDTIQQFGMWLITVQRTLMHIRQLDTELEKHAEMLRVHDATLNEASDTYEQMAQKLISSLSRAKVPREDEPDIRIIEAKKRNTARYLKEGLLEVSKSHTEIMSILAENHSLISQMHSTSLTLTDRLHHLDVMEPPSV